MGRTVRVIATAGHVDHGKSTLVRALTGRDPDRLAEERRRGLTIELGFAWTDLPDAGAVAFVDLPGHERFVPTMLAGIGPVGVALLVVAADEGWMPQTEEHAEILRLLDVRHGVVALTRTDLVDDETVEIAAELVADALAGSGLADAPVVPVSATTGAGLDDLRAALDRVLTTAPPEPDRARPRLWVDRAFSVRGAGTVVTGTLRGGRVAVGDELVVLPGDGAVRVRGIQALEQPVDHGLPGWRVALNLAGVDVEDVPRGSCVAAPGDWVTTDVVEAWCTPAPGRRIGRRGAWTLHVGTAAVPAAVHPTAGADLHEPGPARLELAHPLPLAAGDRVVLRDAGPGGTAGGAVVLEPRPGRRPRGRDRRAESVQRLTALWVASATPVGRVAALVAADGAARSADVRARADATGADVAAADVVVLGDVLLDPATWRTARDLVVQGVVGVHQRRPALAVVPRAEARRLLDTTGMAADVVDLVVDAVVAEGALESVPGGLRAPGHEPRLTVAQQAARTVLLAELDVAGVEPPPLAEAAGRAEADPDLLEALRRAGELHELPDGGRAVSRGALRSAVASLRALEATTGPFTASQARDALGTSRRHAVPLLELTDALGLTVREGDLRRTSGP